MQSCALVASLRILLAVIDCAAGSQPITLARPTYKLYGPA